MVENPQDAVRGLVEFTTHPSDKPENLKMDRKDIFRTYALMVVGEKTIAQLDFEDLEVYRHFKWKLKPNKYRPIAYCIVDGQTRYLHYGVCLRAHGPRPSDDHVCDVRNGDSLDCRRSNLRWAHKDETTYKLAKRAGRDNEGAQPGNG